METLIGLLPRVGVIVGFVVVAYVVQRLLGRKSASEGYRHFNTQLTRLIFTAVGAIVVVIVLPINPDLRGQLLGLLGILYAASIALAATTLVGNALAGMMLQTTRSFRIGDFIRVGDHFGRVSERGLFHSEIQTPDREFTTLPNIYLVTNPVTTTRSSGTIVSATVSLGYSLAHTRIEKLLLAAATQADLEEPFVQIVELGDFSVTYRIAGLLKEVKHMISTRSRLRQAVLDTLHADGVEIVSPIFHNQRRLAADQRMVPATTIVSEPAEETSTPETVVFDKAEEAQDLEELRKARDELIERIKALEEQIKSVPKGPDRDRAKGDLSKLKSRSEWMEKLIADREAEAEQKD